MPVGVAQGQCSSRFWRLSGCELLEEELGEADEVVGVLAEDGKEEVREKRRETAQVRKGFLPKQCWRA